MPVPHDCTDGFICAYWRRPAAYLDPDVRADISNLAQLGDERGPRRGSGSAPISRKAAPGSEHNRALLGLDEIDLGYRLLTSRAD